MFMKIERIEVIVASVPVQNAHPASQEWYERHSKQLLVKVHAEGLCGVGEGFAYGAPMACVEVIDIALAPTLLGKNAADISARAEDMARATRICGRNGIAAFATAAIEIALWDLVGKAQSLAVSTLLGGCRRTSLPTYISLPRFTNADAAAEESRRLVSQGYTGLKLHQLDLESVAATRAAVGRDVQVMLDTNCAWPEEQAKRMAAQFEPMELAWLEEPVWPPEDYYALAQVRASTRQLISLGENEYTLSGFRHCIERGAVDILQPSVAKLGLLLMRQVGDMAARAGVRMVPHSFYFGPALAATAHYLATLEADALMEFPLGDVSVLQEPLQTRSGRLQVPTGPGLGVELNEDMLRRHRLAYREFALTQT